MSYNIQRAAVVGAGIMGAGIAAHLANAGIPVLLLDIVPPDAKDGADRAARNRFAQTGLDRALKARPASAFYTPKAAKLVTVGNTEDDLAKLGEVDWIVEAVFEEIGVKRDLYARIEPVRRPGSVISSNTSGGGGVDVTIGNTAGVAVSAQVGSGAGTGVLVTMTGTAAGGEGILVTTSGVVPAPAIKVDHNSSGTGVEVDATGGTGRAITAQGNGTDIAVVAVGGAGQSAILGTSGTDGAAAIGALGVGTAIGLDASGGSGSSAAIGVRGTAIHVDAPGVYGRTAALASYTTAGVVGEGRGTGWGVYGKNTTGDGYGVVAHSDTSAPEFAALALVQQNNDPINAYGGDVASHSTMNQLRHGVSAGYFKGIYQSPADVSGCSANLISLASNAVYTNNSGVSWTDTLQPYLADDGNGYYGVGPGAELTFTIVMDARLVTATASHVEVQVVDNTNGNAVIFSRTTAGGVLGSAYYLGIATTEWQRAISLSFQYSPPSEGALDFTIQVRKAGGGAGVNIEVRDVGCTIVGTVVP